MERASTVESVSETALFALRCAAPLEPNVDRVGGLRCADDPPGGDLQAPLGDETLNGRGNVGRDAVAVHIPPRPRMTHEALLFAGIEALPQPMGVRTEAVDRRPPAEFGAPLPQPAPHGA